MNAAPVEVCQLRNIPIGGHDAVAGLSLDGSGGTLFITKRFSLGNLRSAGVNLPRPNGKLVDFRQTSTTSAGATEWEAEFSVAPLTVKKLDLPGGKKKGVSFAMDAKGRLHKETFQYQQLRTKKEVGDCWYTQEEFKQFRVDCKKEAISQQKTCYRENFAAVYEACKKGNFKTVTKQRAYVSAASCRGLEAIVYQPLQADRKNLLVTVIKTQRALPETMSRDKHEDAIASASRFLSKQARQLARVLGSGDAAVVMANDRLAASKPTDNVPHEFSS